MIDTLYAGIQGNGDCFRRVDVRHGIRTDFFALDDDRPDFFGSELKPIERIVDRGDTATCHDLDMRGAFPENFPCGLLDFRYAIGKVGIFHPLLCVGHTEEVVIGLAQTPDVEVAARLTQRWAGRVDARPGHVTGIDCFSQPDHRPGCVSCRREPAHEHPPCFHAGFGPDVHPILLVAYLEQVSMQ